MLTADNPPLLTPQQAALRGFLGALIGGASGLLTFFLVVTIFVLPGLAWGYAVGGQRLMTRGAAATAAAFAAAAVLSIGLYFALSPLAPFPSNHPGPFSLPISLTFALDGAISGAIAGIIFGSIAGGRSLILPALSAGLATGFLVPFLLSPCLWPSDATQHSSSNSGWFGDMSGAGILIGELILSPLLAFAISAVFLSPLAARHKN